MPNKKFFVSVDALHPSHQFFSHVRTFSLVKPVLSRELGQNTEPLVRQNQQPSISSLSSSEQIKSKNLLSYQIELPPLNMSRPCCKLNIIMQIQKFCSLFSFEYQLNRK